MSDEAKPADESRIDDNVVTHDPAKAIERAEESHNKAPKPPKESGTNTEGVGVAEMQDAREKHPFVQ